MRVWYRHGHVAFLTLLLGCATTGDFQKDTLFWSSRKADILLAEKRAALESANSNLRLEQEKTSTLRSQEAELLRRRSALEAQVAKMQEAIASSSHPALGSNSSVAHIPPQSNDQPASKERQSLEHQLRELDRRLKALQNRPRADIQALQSELLRLEFLVEEAQRRILKLGQSN
jgi:chromosome segregation ATPase